MPLNSSNQNSARLPRFTVPLLALAVTGVFIWQQRPPTPTPIGGSATRMRNASWHDGVWLWIDDRDEKHSVLVRSDAAGTREIAEEEHIGSYALHGSRVCWAGQRAGEWSVLTEDGAGKRKLWSGKYEPKGIYLDDYSVYWLSPVPATTGSLLSVPAVSAQTALMTAPVNGGPEKQLGVIPEPDGDQIVGVGSGNFFVTCYRESKTGITAIYRLNPGGNVAVRVAGEIGKQSAIMTKFGMLYWTAPGRDASNKLQVNCVRRIRQDGAIETLSDWMPAGGSLYATRKGICYIDGSLNARAWFIGAHDALPQPAVIASGYFVRAAGADDFLVSPLTQLGGQATLYRCGAKR